MVILCEFLPASQATRGIHRNERDLGIVLGPGNPSGTQLLSFGLLESDFMLATLRIMRGNLPRERMPWCSEGREETGLVFVRNELLL